MSDFHPLAVLDKQKFVEDYGSKQRPVLRLKKGLLSIPPALLVPERFHHIVQLFLDGNYLVSLPSDLFVHFPSLLVLNLNDNRLRKLPTNIHLLVNLTFLSVSSNHLIELPLSLHRCPKLAQVVVTKNPLLRHQIPSEIQNDSKKILQHLARLEEGNQNVSNTPLDCRVNLMQHTKLSKEQLCDRIAGVIFGNAIGDAVGLGTEFLTKNQALAHYGCVHPIEFSEFVKDSHRKNWAEGDWTDDTDQLILILESLLDADLEVDCVDFAHRLFVWVQRGFPELGDHVGFGLGQTVGSVVYHPDFLRDPLQASSLIHGTRPRSAANGAVMRTSVLGIPFFWDINKVIENTVKIAKVTHSEERCIASSVAVTTAVALMLQGKYDLNNKAQYDEFRQEVLAYALAQITTDAHINDFKAHFNATSFAELDLDTMGPIGYTLKAMACGFVQLHSTDFAATLSELVFEAGDADTNGAVCGALLGCKLGFSNLRSEWRDRLHQRAWLKERTDRLLNKLGLH